jgi:hypothetical protein
MALGDIQIYSKDNGFGYPGEISYKTATSATTAINAGEPVAKALGNTSGSVVTALATSKPVVGTDYLAGIAATSSTETATVTGTVSVTKVDPGLTYLISPKVGSTWGIVATPVQSTYDALVGARVTFDLTSGVYTLNATDSSANGLVVEPLNIVQFPGKVRFSIRSGVIFNA